MLRTAAAVAVGLHVVQSTSADECMGETCPNINADASSMLQLGRLEAQSGEVRVLDTVNPRAGPPPDKGNSQPYAPPDGAGPAPNGKPLIIDEDGVLNEYYLPGADIIDNGTTVKFLPPYRFYLMKTDTTDYSKAENFYKPMFVGKTFTVEMDFGHDGPGCGCNLNFYLVDMPWPTAGDEGDYYCDAQCFQGKGCCPEFDMNEGNKEVQQVTNHACTGKGSYEGHPDWECNKWGDPELKTHASDFSPGEQHTIDSNKPFTWSQKFDANGGDFIFTTTLSQGEGRQKVLQMGPGNAQLNDMLKNLEKGMAFVTGYWFAPDMNWLDGDECGSGTETCNKNPAYIRNWRITSNDQPVPTPPTPAPEPTPPSPEPTPSGGGGGVCCWGPDCSGCDMNPQAWCNKDSGVCASCGGKMCDSGRPS